MSETPGEKLRRHRKRFFRHAAHAARAHGWHERTYTSHENGHRGIPIEAAHEYAKAFKVPVTEFHPLASATPASNMLTEIVGGSAVGVWRDGALADPKSKGEDDDLTIPVAQISGQTRGAVRVNDESINLFFQPGEYAIIAVDGRKPEVDMVVFVERRRGCLVETSLRLVERTKDGGLRLACHSSNKRYVESIPYPSQRPDETVTIIGHVIGKYADFPPPMRPS